MQLDDAAAIIGRAEFFTICDAEQRRLLAFASERKRFRAGSAIYKHGDTPDGAHILLSGTVATTHEGGEENPYLIHDQGAVLGTLALVLTKPRPVTVKAVDAVETLFIPRTAFLKLCTQYPDLAARAAERIRGELTGYLDAIQSVRGKIGSPNR
jgi:CRP-like cAMP-binding protein